MSEEQKFLKIMLLSLKAGLNARQLTIISHSLFSQPLDNLLISLLDGLRLVELNHHLIQPVFQESDGATHRIFLKES